MSVHKSLRREAKNLYKSAVKELLEYVQDRSCAMSEKKEYNDFFKNDVERMIADITSKMIVADANDINRNSCYIECEKEIGYLQELLKSVDILSRYMSYMANYMYDKNKWFKGEKYSMRMLMHMSELFVKSLDAIQLKIDYIKNLEEEKGLKEKQVYTFEMNEIKV